MNIQSAVQFLQLLATLLGLAASSGNQATIQNALTQATQGIEYVQESGVLNPTQPTYYNDETETQVVTSTQSTTPTGTWNGSVYTPSSTFDNLGAATTQPVSTSTFTSFLVEHIGDGGYVGTTTVDVYQPWIVLLDQNGSPITTGTVQIADDSIGNPLAHQQVMAGTDYEDNAPNNYTFTSTNYPQANYYDSSTKQYTKTGGYLINYRIDSPCSYDEHTFSVTTEGITKSVTLTSQPDGTDYCTLVLPAANDLSRYHG